MRSKNQNIANVIVELKKDDVHMNAGILHAATKTKLPNRDTSKKKAIDEITAKKTQTLKREKRRIVRNLNTTCRVDKDFPLRNNSSDS